jgi:NitT/TauT family transport system permease protein
MSTREEPGTAVAAAGPERSGLTPVEQEWDLSPLPRPARGGRWSGAATWLAPILGLVAFFGIWELLVRVNDTPGFLLEAPSRIVADMADDPMFYVSNGLVTIREALIGFLLALGVGLAVGTVMALSRFMENMVKPVAILVQVTPVIAVAPAIVVWLGGGFRSIIVITFLVCVVPFLFAAVTGLRSVDPATLELLRSVDASRREIFWKLRLPHSLPHLFAAAKVAVGLSLVGATLGEYFALVSEGLGVAIKKAQSFNEYLQLWGSIYSLALIGLLGVLVVDVLERVLLRWHSSQTTA